MAFVSTYLTLSEAAFFAEKRSVASGSSLLAALKEGAIQAELRENGEWRPLDQLWWYDVRDHEHLGYFPGDRLLHLPVGKFNADDIRLKRADVGRLWPAAFQPIAPIQNKGGREPKWDWEGAYIEMARLYFVDKDRPRTRSEMTERIAEWFAKKDGNEPSDSLLRGKLKRFWEACASADK